MQIHVVQKGQTLFRIAQSYGVSEQAIADANELDLADTLVVGQAMVIPIQGQYYWVQAGDSLYAIARRFNIQVEQLVQANRLSVNQVLPIGLRLYIPDPPGPVIEVNAYVEPRGTQVSEALQGASREAAPYLTYLAPFSYRINRDGSLAGPPLDGLAQIATEYGVTLMMVITNLEEGQFSSEVGQILLNNNDIQNRLLDEIIATARRYGFRDIHFDIEFLRPEDREAYNAFLRKAAQRIHQEGYLISTALAPKTSAAQTGPWYTAHDYRAHGEIVDFVVIMTYEWGYSGGPPMAVSPIGPVRQVLEYALTEMPGSKIMMGQNLYGYDWTLPYVAGGEYARALSPQAAIALARTENVAIQYDWNVQAPNFTYIDDEERTHRVWFEDARSIQAKFNLIKELGLRGISYWKLGLPFPQNWELLADNFEIRKR